MTTFIQYISNHYLFHYLFHYLILYLFLYIVYRTLAAFVIQKCFNQYNSRKLEVLREEFSENGKMRCFVLLVRNLEFILRSKGMETVVLAGFLTNCCVESTMRSAYERGFNVITLKDCALRKRFSFQPMKRSMYARRRVFPRARSLRTISATLSRMYRRVKRTMRCTRYRPTIAWPTSSAHFCRPADRRS